MDWFTSDEHFGHSNIIRFCKRPFKDTDEMTKALINNHNSRVAKTDHTWHLGDMFWRTFGVGPAISVLSALNGSHSIVLGNHDELIEESEILRFMFKEVVGSKLRPGAANMPVPNFKKQRLILCHYASRIWIDSHKGSWHLYGHSHAEAAEYGLSFDVGVDSTFCNYGPISMNQVIAMMSQRKSAHAIPVDKVWPGKEPEGSL